MSFEQDFKEFLVKSRKEYGPDVVARGLKNLFSKIKEVVNSFDGTINYTEEASKEKKKMRKKLSNLTK